MIIFFFWPGPSIFFLVLLIILFLAFVFNIIKPNRYLGWIINLISVVMFGWFLYYITYYSDLLKIQTSNTVNHRKPEHKVLDLIRTRWSPRAMSGEPITDTELMSLFEAAKWAPSSYNNQPWRFIYAKRETPEWDKFFKHLVPFNQNWVKNASALILAISRKNYEYNNEFARTHSLDTGAATQNLALQGYSMNLVVHGMEGFDYDAIKKELNIPDDYQVEAMYAVGRPADIFVLSKELQEKEKPSTRKKIEEFVFKGTFGQKLKN